jgi:hypothetical protein
MIYIEFTSRRPQPGLRENEGGTLALESFQSQLQRFHRAVRAAQSGWEGSWSEDQMILSMGRTWRLGPEPEYMTVWYTPEGGLARIGEWDRIFKSGVAADFEEPFKLAARIDKAGCYEPLLEPIPAAKGPFYAEYLDFAPEATRDEVRAFFENRGARHDELELCLLVDRIGKLGPDPRCLAIWRTPGFAALEAIARELDGAEAPVRLVEAGLYEAIGEEIL